MSHRIYLFVLVAVLAGVGCAVVKSYIPRQGNPPIAASRTIEAYISVPREVEVIMARSCNDCHSLQTRWPWYSRVPIVSGILREDVKRGRADMNFSDWSAQVELGWDGERGTLNGICEELQSANMPVHSYLLMHPAARLSQADIQRVCNWTYQVISQSQYSSNDSKGR